MKMPKLLQAFVMLMFTVVFGRAASTPVLTPDQVPRAVRQGFQAKFPTVKTAEWKIKGDKNYEAEFTLKKTEIAAKFDSAGKWLETESAISLSKVPKAVRAAVAKEFKGYEVTETQSVQRWSEDHLIYELHLEDAREIIKAQFALDGTILSQASKPKTQKGKAI